MNECLKVLMFHKAWSKMYVTVSHDCRIMFVRIRVFNHGHIFFFFFFYPLLSLSSYDAAIIAASCKGFTLAPLLYTQSPSWLANSILLQLQLLLGLTGATPHWCITCFQCIASLQEGAGQVKSSEATSVHYWELGVQKRTLTSHCIMLNVTLCTSVDSPVNEYFMRHLCVVLWMCPALLILLTYLSNMPPV